jgi:segregation and condensation protein B
LGWIKPKGRRRTPGRPLTWGTSSAFLDHFGLGSLSELPGVEELKSAGLLRKGQILAGVSELINPLEEDRLDDMQDDDLLAEEFFDDETALDDEWGRDDG